MDPDVAAKIVALRPCVEGFLIRVTQSPESLENLTEHDEQLIKVLKMLSKQTAWRHGLEQAKSTGYVLAFSIGAIRYGHSHFT